jgi:hypothetical protein
MFCETVIPKCTSEKGEAPGTTMHKRFVSAMLLIPAVLLLRAGAALPDTAEEFVAAARWQIGRTRIYDGSYQPLDYPNGDVPLNRGVCTDVVIRAMRSAYGFDLQKQVHEDIKQHFSSYPSRWGLATPDRNIDHRRVPNLKTFFNRRGWSLPVSEDAAAYLPGDIVTCIVPPRLPHIMIVSDRKGRGGVPLIIHNIGAGAQEEDRLFVFELTGHFRVNLPGQAAAAATDRQGATQER